MSATAWKREIVAMELYGCVERYHATQMRTVSLGPLSDEFVEFLTLPAYRLIA